MKIDSLSALAAVTALAMAAPAIAAEPMANMKGMAATPSAAKTGHATGVVTAVDAKAKTVTIKHGPIPGVGWPPMTMAFTATPSTLLKGVKVGQKVAFDVKVQGASNEVTALKAQ